jgi:RNA polymerase sigma-70 factor (ECF subfamily)
MDEIKTLTIDRLSKAKEVSGVEKINFTELYRSNATSVFYYIYSRVGNVSDAEDLTSQTFVTALENLSKLRNPCKFTSWVFSIARNKVYDFFRKSQRRPTANYGENVDQIMGEEGMVSRRKQGLLIDLEGLISRISPMEQEYLRLRIVAELPFAEIASILEEPETRIKKRYYRLLERLKAQVEE